MKYNELIIHTDGGARGNPGPAAIGITAKAGSETLFEISEYIGQRTNNVAEYTAVIHALHQLNKHQVTADNCSFVLDSELIVRQIVGQYRVKEVHLQTLVAEVHRLTKELKARGVTFVAAPYKAPTFDKYFATLKDPDGNLVQLIGPK